MKNALRAIVPLSPVVIGLFILFKVGGGVTVEGSWREFVGCFLIAFGILSEVAVWTVFGVEEDES